MTGGAPHWPRAAGLLLHPTCLPGPHHVGDVGEQSHRFVDFLGRAGQRLWAVLPLGPPGHRESPYAAHSAFAGNPLLVSLHELHREGWLDAADVAPGADGPPDRVDFAAAQAFKLPRLRRAFARFVACGGEDRPDYAAFRARSADWLDDYALFMALKEAHGGTAWIDWPAEFARREPDALARAHARLDDAVRCHRFAQYAFDAQWARLRAYANARRVRLVGDLPIFVAHDSADVWAHRARFELDADGRPRRLAGVPPDYFSATGQLWGNPLYDWARHSAEGFAWWIARFRALLRRVDVARVDHFRGFHACWAVPGEARTAERGAWVDGPGAAPFEAATAALGRLPLFVEDTGLITSEVEALRERLGFPGVRLLHWGFHEEDAFHGAGALQHDIARRHLPHTFTRACVVYTGTHDTDTTVGWFAALGPRERAQVERYLGCDVGAIDAIGDRMIRLALASVADTVIIPVQDVLGLSSAARMNVPGRADGNWRWRLTDGQLTAAHAARLAELTELYDRAEAR